MRKVLVFILFGSALNCFSQDSYTMRVWSNKGNIYQFKTDDIDSITFVKNSDLRNWEEILRFPSLGEINTVNNTSTCKSPYLCAWLKTDIEKGFSQYSVDFKADYLPLQTYCSLASFHIDYSTLLERYDSVNNGGHVSAYCGFQRINKPDLPEYNGILSIWDTYCKDHTGKIDTIRATLVSSSGAQEIKYDHEGYGVSCRPEYRWKPGNWYRMLVQCVEPEDESNTQIWFWVGDLNAKTWKQLCIFDLGAPGLKFKGDTAVFLEDWLAETSGEIRTLEFKNVRIYSRAKGWQNVYSGYFSDRDSDDKTCYSGSYQYGNDDSIFWMITTGVPNCAEPQQPNDLTVDYSDEGNPLTL